MIRAQYDSNGNIILASLVEDIPSPIRDEYSVPTKKTDTWTIMEETHRKVQAIKSPEPLCLPRKNHSVLHTVGVQTKKILRQSASESGRQFMETSLEAGSGITQAKKAIQSLPKKAACLMHSFWHIAQAPVALPLRKPGKRPPRRITLFLIDTVRFGGTFGLIFATLFIGINYQSFWQIARAELALGTDIKAEQALSDITMSSDTIKNFKASQSPGKVNILAYLPRVGPFEDRLIIPKLGENVPIVRPSMEALMKEDWKKFEDDIQVALKGGVVHYPGSATPGQAGNFFLTGHSSYYPWDDGKYKNVFARLHELDLGDTYTVYYGGDRHTYRITKKYEVKPSNVSVLDQPTSQRISTLMTCTPIGTTLRRLIVQAEEIDPISGDILSVGEKTADTPKHTLKRLDALPI